MNDTRDTKRIIGVVAAGFVSILVIARMTDDPRRPSEVASTSRVDAGLGGPPADASAPTDARAACVPPAPYETSMKAAADHLAASRQPEALAAYHEAIRARPFSIDAWAGAARARGNDPLALGDFAFARSLTREPKLLAQLFFEEGLVQERQGDNANAKIAFGRAEAHGATEAKTKVGCTAVVDRRPNDLDLASTWKDVLSRMFGPGCELPPAEDDATAKAFACGGCTQGAWKKGTCEGEGPWTIAMGERDCVASTATITPLSKGRFWIASSGNAGTRFTREGTRFHLHTKNSVPTPVRLGTSVYRGGAWTADGCRGNEESAAPLATLPGCAPTKAPTITDGEALSVFDEAGKHVVTVRTFDEHATIATEGDVVKVRGAGCTLDVSLLSQ